MRPRIVTSEDFFKAIGALVKSGLDNGMQPGTLAIALRLEADELDDQVPASQAYK